MQQIGELDSLLTLEIAGNSVFLQREKLIERTGGLGPWFSEGKPERDAWIMARGPFKQGSLAVLVAQNSRLGVKAR